eukprot:11190344-Alexandrium_andersonii.AAC.1
MSHTYRALEACQSALSTRAIHFVGVFSWGRQVTLEWCPLIVWAPGARGPAEGLLGGSLRARQGAYWGSP